MIKSQYKLSVRLITYNHSSFIEQAIEGVLNQKTNFLIELVIGDDFSTDNTRELIASYQSTSNVHIKILDRPVHGEYHKIRNSIGRLYNFANTIENCSGEYIALLDGDDYWTDPFKLQKQVDYMDNNPTNVITFHDADYINSNNIIIKEGKIPDKYKCLMEPNYLKTKGYILTLTVVFRNVIKKFPDEFFQSMNGDKFLFSLLGSYGYGNYLSNIENAKYRVHDNGIWGSSIKGEGNKYRMSGITYFNLSRYYSKLDDQESNIYFHNKYLNCQYGLLEISLSNRKWGYSVKLTKEIIKNFKHLNNIPDFLRSFVKGLIKIKL